MGVGDLAGGVIEGRRMGRFKSYRGSRRDRSWWLLSVNIER